MREKYSMGKYTVGFGLSASIMSILSSLLVVLKETSAPLKAWMAATLGHHWVTHGAIVMILFIVLGLIFSNIKIEEKWNAEKMTKVIIIAVTLGGLILAGFFLMEL